jgi:DNA-binding NtrC family response regulator
MEEALRKFEETLINTPLEPINYYKVVDRLESIIMNHYVKSQYYRIARAAEYLGLGRSTTSMRMKKLGIINLAYIDRVEERESNEKSSKKGS